MFVYASMSGCRRQIVKCGERAAKCRQQIVKCGERAAKCRRQAVENEKRVDGMVTVFLSMVMLCVFSLLCCLTESARTAGARWYLQTSASSALDSVFSQYHRQLWDTYRLLFAEYEEEQELEQDFAGFLNPYLEAGKWFPMVLEQASVTDWNSAVEENAKYLEQEILEYMKYGIWDLDFEADTPETLWNTAAEAGTVKRISGKYRSHAREALKLEKTLEKISENQDRQQKKKQEGLERLQNYDCYGFCDSAEGLIRELEKVPGLVASYERQADELAEHLRSSRENYEEEKGDCSGKVQGQLEEEIREYESYVDEDGKRRQEIRALDELSETQIQLVHSVIKEALEVQDIIDNWDYGDDEEENDGPDYDALWSPVISHFQQMEIRPLSFRHGVKDKEKEGFLNHVEEMYRGSILKLVVPREISVSKRKADRTAMPSAAGSWSAGSRVVPLLDRLMINTYEGKFFRNFRTDLEAVDNKPGIPGDDGLAYEMEYLLGGNDLDEANLTAAVNQLLAVREGLNLVYLLSDSAKRAEARSLAMAVTGITGLAPLVILTEFFVLSVWALGEALMDIRGLLSGKKVPLFKSAETWTLGMDGLLAMGKEGEVANGGGESGLDYLTWLKILLFKDDTIQQEYRMMDMIQMNIRRKQNAFRMRRCRYQAELDCSLKGKHVFFSLGFMQPYTGNTDYTYPMKLHVERRY